MAATVSVKLKDGEKDPRKIVGALNRLAEGRSDNYGSVTLTPGADATIVDAYFASENSTVIITPRTLSAALELAAGGCFISAKGNRSFTITHANSGVTDRVFDYAFIG